MRTYIALLRGINVGGHRKIKMTNLKGMLEKLGFKEVHTYIQSGNIIFKSDVVDANSIEDTIKQGILETFGFDVPVLVKTRATLKHIMDANPFYDRELLVNNNIYYVLLQQAPEKHLKDNLQQTPYENEEFIITDECVYLACLKGYAKAKCDNNLFEKKLKVQATARNHNTMLKLLEMAGS